MSNNYNNIPIVTKHHQEILTASISRETVACSADQSKHSSTIPTLNTNEAQLAKVEKELELIEQQLS